MLCTARLLIEAGVLSPQQVLDAYEHKRSEVQSLATEVAEFAQLDSATR